MDKKELINFARTIKAQDKAKMFGLLINAWEQGESIEEKLQEQLSFLKLWQES